MVTEKIETSVRCPGSATLSEDGRGPAHHCDACGKYYPDAEIQATGGYFPEHRRLRDKR